MNVILISPGFPPELALFTRGLAEQGAHVWGVGDQAEAALPDVVRQHLFDYLRIPSLHNEDGVVEAVRRWASGQRIDRVESVWEPGVLIAGRLREVLGAKGHSRDEIVPFRDKNRMKQVLQAAGIRTPRAARATTARGVHEAAERLGFPLIVKPIAGAGSQDTYRVDDVSELTAALVRLDHVADVSVEEYIDGEEYTHDTVCVDGRVVFEHVAWYRPRPLIARHVEWITPQVISLRDLDAPDLADGIAMGRAVLGALGYGTGFTHMEWFRKPDGEVVFGEIGARPGGGRLVDSMNYACDTDLFAGWAEAVAHGRFSQPTNLKYNTALMFKRGRGSGIIRQIEGLDSIRARFGEHIAAMQLPAVGTPRADWRRRLTAEGWMVVRHPDLQTLLDMADTIATELQLNAW